MPCSICHQNGHNKRTCELNTKVATTGKYAGLTAVQIEAIFAERERKNYEELVAPIIAQAKLARADCGQVETECRLEITEQGKTLCCDCLSPKKEESIPEMKDCGHFFDCGCGMTVCGECDEDMCDNEACAIYYTYRNDACMCDGCDFCEWKIRIHKSGMKITPPFVPE